MASSGDQSDNSSSSQPTGAQNLVPPLTTHLQQTASTAITSITSLSQFVLPSLNQPLAIKFDRTNYLVWKNQLLNVIIANGLEDFIDGSRPCPMKFLNLEQGMVNPEYTLWHRYSRLIMSWLYASVSDNVMTQIIGYNSAKEIWAALAQIFAQLQWLGCQNSEHRSSP